MKKAITFSVCTLLTQLSLHAEPIEPEMTEIPAGSFTMGHDKWGSYVNNKPAHNVSIKKFALAKYEVTNKEFQHFVKETDHKLAAEERSKDGTNCVELTFKNKEPNFRRFSANWNNFPPFEPVACISFSDIEAYIGWLAQKTNKPYRLPSEAEWEYAARAGTTTKFFYGNDKHKACAYGNVNDVNQGNKHKCDDGYKSYAPVGMFKPNPWGLYDVIGNVDEFVADCEHINGYEGAPTDQIPWDSHCSTQRKADALMHIRRGGAAMVNLSHLTARAHMGENFGTIHAGFRLAMDIPSHEKCKSDKGLCAVNNLTKEFRSDLSAAQSKEKAKILKK
jgi:formylglycine-generating enzyme required for sulfatase activity